MACTFTFFRHSEFVNFTSPLISYLLNLLLFQYLTVPESRDTLRPQPLPWCGISSNSSHFFPPTLIVLKTLTKCHSVIVKFACSLLFLPTNKFSSDNIERIASYFTLITTSYSISKILFFFLWLNSFLYFLQLIPCGSYSRHHFLLPSWLSLIYFLVLFTELLCLISISIPFPLFLDDTSSGLIFGTNFKYIHDIDFQISLSWLVQSICPKVTFWPKQILWYT